MNDHIEERVANAHQQRDRDTRMYYASRGLEYSPNNFIS